MPKVSNAFISEQYYVYIHLLNLYSIFSFIVNSSFLLLHFCSLFPACLWVFFLYRTFSTATPCPIWVKISFCIDSGSHREGLYRPFWGKLPCASELKDLMENFMEAFHASVDQERTVLQVLHSIERWRSHLAILFMCILNTRILIIASDLVIESSHTFPWSKIIIFVEVAWDTLVTILDRQCPEHKKLL